MARSKTRTSRSDSSVKVKKTSDNSSGMNFDFQNNRSIINLVLGAAVLVVLGVVLFNFLSSQRQSNPEDLGPSQQTENTQQGDIAKESLPGKYTVKEGDTLFLIAQNYFNDGFKYTELVAANKLADENNLEVGQVLDIPKLTDAIAQASPVVTPTPVVSPAPAGTMTPVATDNQTANKGTQELGTGGDPNQTVWGAKISNDSYTVQAGDWLSKVAGRAYGDVMQYQKLAQANNITNPDIIEVGMVLKIPR